MTIAEPIDFKSSDCEIRQNRITVPAAERNVKEIKKTATNHDSIMTRGRTGGGKLPG